MVFLFVPVFLALLVMFVMFVVFVLMFFMTSDALGVGRGIALPFEPGPELELHPLELELFQREEGESLLVHGRRQSLFAGCAVVPVDAPDSKAPAPDPLLALLGDRTIDELIIVKLGADDLIAVLEMLNLVVLPAYGVQLDRY